MFSDGHVLEDLGESQELGGDLLPEVIECECRNTIGCCLILPGVGERQNIVIDT
jgi:hypothetical protein